MIKTHKKSEIIQFHHTSGYGKKLLDEGSGKVVIQIEAVNHGTFDFIAEIISKKDYEEIDIQEEKIRNLENELQDWKDRYKDISKGYNDVVLKSYEYFQLLKEANEYIKDNLNEGCLTAEIDKLIEKAIKGE